MRLNRFAACDRRSLPTPRLDKSGAISNGCQILIVTVILGRFYLEITRKGLALWDPQRRVSDRIGSS